MLKIHKLKNDEKKRLISEGIIGKELVTSRAAILIYLPTLVTLAVYAALSFSLAEPPQFIVAEFGFFSTVIAAAVILWNLYAIADHHLWVLNIKSRYRQQAEIKLTCSHCNHVFSYGANWICRTCGDINTTSHKKYQTPSMGCGYDSCTKSKQIAISCPECMGILTLDHDEFERSKQKHKDITYYTSGKRSEPKKGNPKRKARNLYDDI